MNDLVALAGSLGETPHVIECVCAEEVVRGRLERDAAQGGHPAGNRTLTLYQTLQAAAEPITLPRLVLDTGRLSVAECLTRCRAYLGRAASTAR